ncbi:MAG: type II toxin-antitoxin system mRNA interferase toxin, RelE/StbE family [Dethiosulfovibrio peptidovorans]|nr:MAG: type II toxin-antitoxin system mRNA interferase toxin, RelE/StbE family [Dethiosulfovibrio peptidovorans]
MAWRVELSRGAEKDLASIDKPEALRIVKYLARLETLENPRERGKNLSGDLSDFWRYRVGSWRVLCRIEDNKLLVLIVRIGHRSSVYS